MIYILNKHGHQIAMELPRYFIPNLIFLLYNYIHFMNELISEEIKIQNDVITMFEENCIWLIGNIHDDDEYCLSGLIANQVVISSFLRKLSPKNHGYLQWMNLIEYVRTCAPITEQYIYYNHGIRDEELETIKAQELTDQLKKQKAIADDIIVQQQDELCRLMIKLGFEYCIADDQKRKELEPLINRLRTSYYATQKYMRPTS